jgi:NADPH2:quinone reductase
VGTDVIRAAAEDINAAIRDGALPVGEEAGLPLHL